MTCDLCPILTGQVSNNLQHCAGMTAHSNGATEPGGSDSIYNDVFTVYSEQL
jgi:hypothetical protein